MFEIRIVIFSIINYRGGKILAWFSGYRSTEIYLGRTTREKS